MLHWRNLLRDLTNDDMDVSHRQLEKVLCLFWLTNLPSQAAVETLLNQYSEEMRCFYRSNPEMLLLVSLRAKLAKLSKRSLAKETCATIDEKRSSLSKPMNTPPTHSTTTSTRANCSFDPAAISSWLGGERQIEKALEKIIDYVENAGEITQLQKSLMTLHQTFLDRNLDTSMIDRRLYLVSFFSLFAKMPHGCFSLLNFSLDPKRI